MKKRPDPEPIPMTPMIDIVFQLIIFFVLTAANDPAKLEQDIKLGEVPNAPEVIDRPIGTVHVQIKQNGAVMIGPAVFSHQALSYQMKNMVAQFGQNVPVVIHADERVKHSHVSKVMNILAGAGLWQMNLSAYTIHR
jgi:biopolymer transport protein ExbD